MPQRRKGPGHPTPHCRRSAALDAARMMVASPAGKASQAPGLAGTGKAGHADDDAASASASCQSKTTQRRTHEQCVEEEQMCVRITFTSPCSSSGGSCAAEASQPVGFGYHCRSCRPRLASETNTSSMRDRMHAACPSCLSA
jgi:hypothetical protein